MPGTLLFRHFIVGFAATALLTLAACSSGNDDEPVTPIATATTEATATPPAPTATPGPPPKLGTYTGAVITQKAPDFTAMPGATAEFGILGKAAFQIEKPANWNGDLVMFAHGFVDFGTQVAVQPPPGGLRELFIAEGYAWAASSFSENGYTPGIGADDTLALKEYFASRYGEPERTYLVGESMGGNSTALSLENFPGEYDGALAACGALWGINQVDFLISWAMLAEYFSGVALPIGEGGEKMGKALLTDVPAVLGTAGAPTHKGQQFIDAIRNLSGGPRPFFVEGYSDRAVTNLGLLLIDPNRQTLVGSAATNTTAVYHVDPALGVSDAELNAVIRRLAADPASRNAAAHPDAVPTTGKISVPLLTIHGTGDLFVPIEAERVYRERVVAAGKGDLLVQRAIRSYGHCKFSDQEWQTAFHDLVTWVEEGKRPAGEDLSGDLTDAGKAFTNPVRANDPGGK
jgi:pimeloyl-ACP methyl ester carboxylesterase